MLEKVEFAGWENCYRLHNKQIELIVTTDVGPRIIYLGYLGEENFFKTCDEELGETGGAEFRLYGGHRLWHAPEDLKRTYYPDNDPVIVEVLKDGAVRFTAPIEKSTGIEKSIDVKLHPKKPEISLVHHFTNHNLWEIETALWALTVMAQGGTAIIPLPSKGAHRENLLPKTTLALWAYTNMADPRWTWGSAFIMLRQTDDATSQKVGTLNTQGWAGYVNKNCLFIKMYDVPEAGVTYPDMGVNTEIFTNDLFLEVESLSPLHRIAPGESASHTENWHFVRGVETPQTEEDVRQNIIPILEALKR